MWVSKFLHFIHNSFYLFYYCWLYTTIRITRLYLIMYCKIKKFKLIKSLLLKIFILQKKNRLSFNILLNKSSLSIIIFLWKAGFILGFTLLTEKTHTIFLKRQFKEFYIKFFELKTNYKWLCKFKQETPTISTNLIFSSKGLLLSLLPKNPIGGFFLCNIY